jgi:hypothetical protein
MQYDGSMEKRATSFTVKKKDNTTTNEFRYLIDYDGIYGEIETEEMARQHIAEKFPEWEITEVWY